MPQARKPNKLKVVRGTDQACRMNDGEIELETLSQTPDAPDWLDHHGVQEWNRVAPALVAKGLLSAVDVTPLAHYCDAHAHILRQKNAQQKVTASDRQCLSQLAGKFYLTPASRAAVATNAKKDANPWARNGRP